jgi:hypothetical protein
MNFPQPGKGKKATKAEPRRPLRKRLGYSEKVTHNTAII